MKPLPLLSLSLLLLATAGGAWWLAGSRGEAGSKGGSPAVTVVLAPARLQDVPIALDLTARTEAYESVNLRARVDGQIKDLPFADGQPLAKDQVIARLDPADFQARLRQAEANLARSRSEAAKARADLERYQALRDRGFVSAEKLTDLRTALEAAEAGIGADQAALDLARLQLDYATVRAPFAGVVGTRQVYPGSTVKANDTVIAVINRVQPLQIAFSLPERHLPALRQALAGKTPVPVVLRLPGSAEPVAEARVTALDNAVDAATGTLLVKALTDNRDQSLTAGQFVEVSLVLGRVHAAVTVPAQAIQQSVDGPMLFVVKDEAATPRQVKVGPIHQGVAVIESELAVDEMVVTEGHLRLTPGARVRPAGSGKARD